MTVMIMPSTITVIGDGIFDGCDNLSTLMVPTDSQDDFAELAEEYELNVVPY